MNPKKRAKEERDSKRASARDIKESMAPRTTSLASTVAPACSSASTVFVCPFGAETKRGVRSSCCRGGVRGESCRGGQGALAYMHTHGCVPGCVCVNQYMQLHAHIPRYVHTVYTCVCICTHTCAHTHTQICIQDTNPKLWDSRIQKPKKKENMKRLYIYRYIFTHICKHTHNHTSKPHTCVYTHTHTQMLSRYKLYTLRTQILEETNQKA